MFPLPSSCASAGAAAALTFGFATTALEAGVPPELTIDWLVGADFAGHLTPDGTDAGGGLFTYAGTDVHDATGVILDFDLDGHPDGRLGGDLVITNPSLSAVELSLLVTLPINEMPDTLLRGSADLELITDDDGGSVTSVGGAPVWLSFIDGAPVLSATLFPDPFEIVLSGAGRDGVSSAFGRPDGIAGPSASKSMGLLIQFSLTPGDQVSLSGVLIIPGPATSVLLIGGWVIGGTRRRRGHGGCARQRRHPVGSPALRREIEDVAQPHLSASRHQ